MPLVLSGLFEHSLGVCCVSGLSQGAQKVVLESMSSVFYTPPHNSGGVLWVHVGRSCVCPSVR